MDPRKPPDAQEVARLRRRAIALLARREYSREELRRKLAQPARPPRHPRADDQRAGAGTAFVTRQAGDATASKVSSPDPHAIEVVLDDVVAHDYQSDTRFAEGVTRSGSLRFGNARIARTLKAKGLAQADIDAAMAPVRDTENARLVQLWGRRFGSPPADDREYGRQLRFLVQRGFSMQAVAALLRRARRGEIDEGEFQ